MTTAAPKHSTTEYDPTTISVQEAAALLQAPLGPAKGSQLMALFTEFRTATGERETARICRHVHFILDNVSFMDADDYAGNRDAFARWFHDERKKLMKRFLDSAQALDG